MIFIWNLDYNKNTFSFGTAALCQKWENPLCPLKTRPVRRKAGTGAKSRATKGGVNLNDASRFG
jgi:hypothetical protein